MGSTRQYKDLPLDEVLARYATEKSMPFEFAIHHARYLFAREQLSPNSSALDIGCAYGFGTVLLSERAARVIGLDEHEGIIQYAREHYARPNVEYIAGDCLDYEFPAESFDLITLFEVIEHLDEPGRILERCASWLKPGGRLVLSTPNKLVHLLMGITWEFHVKEYGYSELYHLLRNHFPETGITILGQNAHMLDHFKKQSGRFKPYETPWRRTVRTIVPRPLIRMGRKMLPYRPPRVNAASTLAQEAQEIGAENVDLADTFIAVCQALR